MPNPLVVGSNNDQSLGFPVSDRYIRDPMPLLSPDAANRHPSLLNNVTALLLEALKKFVVINCHVFPLALEWIWLPVADPFSVPAKILPLKVTRDVILWLLTVPKAFGMLFVQ